MMHSPLFKIVGAVLVALAVLIFLFRGALGPIHPPPTIHSTLTPATGAGK
ncbi:MAG TPA: hypothetical protein VGZ93_08135 [Candidatus Methylacidiphilales bacterium]|jgi:hypothetical protein|nr:hypothetical protein [Candidatus Methylacidiphilales bacterium]